MATGGASMRSLAQQATAATPLTGNWRLTMQLQVVGGQPPQRLPGDTTMRFAADGTWRLDESRAWSAGTYRWLDARRIELTTTDASRPTQVGEVALRIVRMEPGTLYLTSRVGGGQAGGGTNAGQAASPAGQNGSEVAVTGVFTRIDDR
jgi:hypothetical protein